MKIIKGKNRQREALRNGKNYGRVINQVTSEKMKVHIKYLLEYHGVDILEAAKDFYKLEGRGCVNISLIDHPDCPLKTGLLQYITEDSARSQSKLTFESVLGVQVSEGISTYEPTTQAVVCFWYGANIYTMKLTGRFVISTAMKRRSLTIH